MGIRFAAILAGGQSTRMGRDKAALVVAGMSMLERVARKVQRAELGVVVVGRERPAGWPADIDAKFLPDHAGSGGMGGESGGPIVGLIAALEDLHEPTVVVGCDMPLLTMELLRGIVAAHSAARGRHVTMAVAKDDAGIPRPEPLLAVYEPTILPVLHDMLSAGRRSLLGLMGTTGVASWPVPPALVADMINVNDAAELTRATERLNARETTH